MRYSKELLKGGTPLLVMSVLDGKDLYGYRIIKGLMIGSLPFGRKNRRKRRCRE